MGLHKKLVDLLKLPLARTDPDLLRHTYGLLTAFCHKCPHNQEALFGSGLVPLFVAQVFNCRPAIECALALFQGQYSLCAQITEDLIDAVVTRLIVPEEDARSPALMEAYFEFLRSIVIVNGIPITRNQTLVMKSLLERQVHVHRPLPSVLRSGTGPDAVLTGGIQ